MSVEKKIKEKLKKAEIARDRLVALDERKQETMKTLEVIDELTKESSELLYAIEDYFVEHYASIKVEQIQIMKDAVIEVLIAHIGTSTFVCFGGLICSAKVHPEDIDKFSPEVGEAIAKQKLINKILAANYGVEF